MKIKLGYVEINGQRYSGNNLSIVNGKVMIDGKEAEECSNSKTITINITGDVEGNVELSQGTINCGNVQGNVTTKQGNITSGDVQGDAINKMGNITCKNVGGNVDTKMGNVRYTKVEAPKVVTKPPKDPEPPTFEGSC